MQNNEKTIYLPFTYKTGSDYKTDVIYIPKDVISKNNSPEKAFELTTGFSSSKIISYDLSDARTVDGQKIDMTL